MPAMQLSLVADYAAFKKMHTAWNAFLAHSGRGTVFLTHEWVDCWWRHFGAGNRLMILAAHNETGGLCGIAPLMLRMRGSRLVRIRSLEFIGSGNEVTPDHLGFMVAEHLRIPFVGAVFGRLLTLKSEWDTIRLTDLTHTALSLSDMPEYILHKHRHSLHTNGICPYIRLSGTWPDYVAGLSGEMRYSLRRKERTVEKKLGIHFEVWSDYAVIGEGIDWLYALHRKRMAQKKLDGVSLQPWFWRFHDEVAKSLARKGQVVLGMLMIKDRVIACQYAFHYAHTMSFYQSGIDTDYRSYGIGTILTARMIEESMRRGVQEYDFLRGDEGYKFHWTSTYRRNYEFFMWNDSLKAGALAMVFSIKRSIKELIAGLRRSPAVIPGIRPEIYA